MAYKKKTRDFITSFNDNTVYDVTGAFEDIELALIKSMSVNMKRHIQDEYDEGINWTQWQAEMLAGLSQYRAENADVLKGYMGKVNKYIDMAIREAYATGESDQEVALLEAIKAGYKAPKGGKGTNMQGSFFRTNTRKLNALIKATGDDMKKAETALLRMSNDAVRQSLFKAQMFYTTGAGGMWKCVDMATKDLRGAGFNCVEYKNGARVNIASYSEMALRTANKRANMMGAAGFREKHGMYLVKINARGTACPMCLPFLGRVYVDDVYGAGTAKESAATGYPLLSSAVRGGLFHPNCKDACSTYYEGINQPPRPITEAEAKEANRRYDLEQTQRYCERQYRKNKRLSNGAMSDEDMQKYAARAEAYKKRALKLCEDNPDVLRYDPNRMSLRGDTKTTPKPKKPLNSKSLRDLLDVDKDGRIIPKIPIPTPSHSPEYNALLNRMQGLDKGIDYLAVKGLKKIPTDDDLVKKLAGGDLTNGSCASLGLAYAANKAGYDVTDYRGGASQGFFSTKFNLDELMKLLPKGSVLKEVARSYGTAGKRLLAKVEKGKEYFFYCGRHAAMVRRTDKGVQYLELQSGHSNGWKDFDGNVRYTLSQRFGCTGSQGRDVDATMVDVDAFKGCDEMRDLLGFINTDKDKQKKGAGGFER